MRHLVAALAAALLIGSLAPLARAQDGSGDTPKPAAEESAEPAAEEPAKGASDTPEEMPAAEAQEPPAVHREVPEQRSLDGYRLRVGDTISVVVYLHNELSVPGISVPGNGEIAFSPIGKVNLLDKTVFEVAGEIRRRLQEEDFLTDPKVDVLVTGYAPRLVYLIGAAAPTVSLPVHKNVRLLEVLAMSGALGSPTIDLARVTIRRTADDGTSYNIDVSVDDILDKNMDEKNVVVFENDLIRVRQLEEATPLSSDYVYILGKVRNPGRHPIVKGRSTFTLTKLIALAGDFEEFAKRTEVTVIRKTDTGRLRKIYNFDDIIEGKIPDVDLSADDLVYVPESFF